MAITAKIDAIDKDLALFLKEELSPEARKATMASFAREELGKAQAANRQALGYEPQYETFVDGRRGAALESVNPDGGTILFAFDLLEDVFAWIGEQLVLHAPVLTGDYQRSFMFLADGAEVPMGAEAPTANEYVFLNSQPYSRKLERGHSAQVPDGVFQVVAALAKRRFGNLANIKFSYRALGEDGIVPYQAVGVPAARAKNGRFTAAGADRTAQKTEHSLRTPAIVITLR
ncbi:hypothetical protein FHR70_003732 [Microvirga lupini]|uniref:Uncharacterized protein n=1 Tax=Microvirga lupini TaxID=420324 RepID=A0A7W4YY16_9HYPH|nr:hypothetical protein [Microvirga lupini]MBB3020646.1 hypothetical protein [Microvirga lupini]